MYKAFDFKGTLDEKAMKEISKFWGKNVELIIRELPLSSDSASEPVKETASATPDEWLRKFFQNLTGNGGR